MVMTVIPPTALLQEAEVRGVALLPGERVVHLFTPRDGLVEGDAPPEAGRLLVATNQRLISFSSEAAPAQVVLVPVEEVKGVVVKTVPRGGSSLWMQGLLLALAGVVLYLVAGYWLEGRERFTGPEVPFINVDLGPLILLLAIAGAVWYMGRRYFTREESSVTFQGSSWSFAFAYRGRKPEEEIYQVVNGLFASRRSRDSSGFPWDE
jgi:hypothetical protein